MLNYAGEVGWVRQAHSCLCSDNHDSSAYYWCYDHRNRNRSRFFNWKSNRNRIFRASRQTICPLKHWIAYRGPRRASKDRPLSAALSVGI